MKLSAGGLSRRRSMLGASILLLFGVLSALVPLGSQAQAALPTDAQAGIVVDGNLEPIYSSHQALRKYDVTTDSGEFEGVLASVETQEAYYVGFQQAFTAKSNAYCDDKKATPGCYQDFGALRGSDYISFTYGTMEIGVDIISENALAQPSGFSGNFNEAEGASHTDNVPDLTGVKGKSAMDYNMNVLGWYSSFGNEFPNSPNFTAGQENHPYIYPSVAEIRLDKAKLNLPANFDPLSAAVEAHNSPAAPTAPRRSLVCETIVAGDQPTGQNVTIGRFYAQTGLLGDDGEKIVATLVPGSVGSIVSVGGTPGTSGTTSGGGYADVVVASSQTGSTSIAGFWDLDNDGVHDVGTEPVTATACQMQWAPSPQAKIRIDPPQDANQVGQDHPLTVTVSKKGQGDNDFVPAPQNTVVTLTKVSGPGSFKNNVNTCSTNVSGQCTVTIVSSATGLTTVSASSNVNVDGQVLAVSTNGQAGSSGPAVKRWVNARLELNPPQDANEVNDTHTFTAHLMFDKGDGNGFLNAPAGETINFTHVSGPGTLAANSCVTAAGGTCTVNLQSAVTGLSTLKAAWNGTITVAEGVATASTTSNDALKRWAKAKLTLTPPEAVNHIGDTHTFTADLEFDRGDGNGFVDAGAGEIINFSKTGVGALAANSCMTNAVGRCTVDLTSSVTGTSTVKANWAGVIGTAEGNASASTQSNDAVKRWVDALISITPNDANQVNNEHTFTIEVRKIQQGASSPAAGVNAQASITNSLGAQGAFVGANNCTTNASGECTVKIVSPTTGLSTVSAAATVTVDGEPVAVATNGQAGNSAPAKKRWVDARLTLTPPQDANHVGDTHTFTADLDLDFGGGAGFVNAPAGETIDFTKVSGPGALSAASCTTVAGGTCTVDLDSAVTGLSTLKASWSGTIATAEGTASATTTSGNAIKRWVDARLTLTPPSAVNHIGDTHTFTAHLEFDTGSGFGDAPAGETIDFTKASGPGDLSAASCDTDANGECTVDLDSTVTGTTEVEAEWNGVVATAQGNVNASAGDDAEKRWVDALILINPPEDTNEVGDDHVFTVTVKKSEQGVVSNAVGVDVQTSIKSGPGSYVGSDACTTDANGECDVTISSTDSGLTVVEAEATVTVDGVDVLVKTDGLFNNSEPAEKRWVDARLSVTPPEATNVIGDTHTFAAHLEFDLGDGAGFVDAPAGEVVTWTKTGPGAFVSDSCTTDADGTCSVELDSDEVGTTEVEASWTGAVTTAEGSATMTRSDGATKDWVEPAIRIIKTANPVLGPPRTVTFTYLVTNIGDVTLTDIDVTDDIIGFIGTIDSLDPGESATLTKDSEVDENTPRTNIGTACGDPTVGGVVIGKEVCDDDPASIVVVLPQPPQERRLPRTGFGLRQWLFIAGLFLAAGAAGLNLELKTANDRGRSS